MGHGEKLIKLSTLLVVGLFAFHKTGHLSPCDESWSKIPLA